MTRKYAQQYSNNYEKPRFNILPKIQREINEKMWAELYAPQMIPLVDLVDFKKINSMNTNMTVMENLDQTALRRVSNRLFHIAAISSEILEVVLKTLVWS